MKKIFHLSTCDTCRKILGEIDTNDAEMINIREQNIDKETLEMLSKELGSYEALFNKRAQKLKEMTPDQKPTKESDYKKLILKEYTFLKRPVIICGNQIYVGNEKSTVEKLKKDLPKR
jgi:arsenate reductase (glutaredoxin)